jgi:hypothetical protein
MPTIAAIESQSSDVLTEAFVSVVKRRTASTELARWLPVELVRS